MAIKKEIVDELLKGVDPKAVFSSEGLLSEIKKALAERMLNAELDQHLEAEADAAAMVDGTRPGNHRNGYSKKTVITCQCRQGFPRKCRTKFPHSVGTVIGRNRIRRPPSVGVRGGALAAGGRSLWEWDGCADVRVPGRRARASDTNCLLWR